MLHTRIRYVLFIPWLFQYSAENRTRGSDLGRTIDRLLIELAQRLRMRETYDVIGGDKLGQLTSQPPDRVYWTALREWGLLLGVRRSEVVRRLAALGGADKLDDDGARLDDDPVEVFYNLPKQPSRWEDANAPLEFRLAAAEKDFLRRKLSVLARRGTISRSLLARLVDAGETFPSAATPALPRQLDARADEEDQKALGIARDAANLSAIGRAVYGALVEHLREADGRPTGRMFHAQLYTHFDAYGESAARCDLEGLTMFLANLPPFVNDVLHKTRDYVRKGKPGDFLPLQSAYEYAEVRRKTSARPNASCSQGVRGRAHEILAQAP